MGFGFWVLGLWIQGYTGPRLLGLEFKIPGFTFRILGLKSKIPGSRFRILGLESKISGSRFRIPGFESKIPGCRFRILGLESTIPGTIDRFEFWVFGFGIRVLGFNMCYGFRVHASR